MQENEQTVSKQILRRSTENCSIKVLIIITLMPHGAHIATELGLPTASDRLRSGLKRSQVPVMMELLSFTGKSEVRACLLLPVTAMGAGWLRDDWPGQVPIALPSMA